MHTAYIYAGSNGHNDSSAINGQGSQESLALYHGNDAAHISLITEDAKKAFNSAHYILVEVLPGSAPKFVASIRTTKDGTSVRRVFRRATAGEAKILQSYRFDSALVFQLEAGGTHFTSIEVHTALRNVEEEGMNTDLYSALRGVLMLGLKLTQADMKTIGGNIAEDSAKSARAHREWTEFLGEHDLAKFLPAEAPESEEPAFDIV